MAGNNKAGENFTFSRLTGGLVCRKRKTKPEGGSQLDSLIKIIFDINYYLGKTMHKNGQTEEITTLVKKWKVEMLCGGFKILRR